MLRKILILKFFVCFVHNFGTNCRQLINNHFFDLSQLQSDNDYQFLYQSLNDDLEFNFNFCKYVKKNCDGYSFNNYYMVAYNENTCDYYNTDNHNQQDFYVIETEDQKGLGINYTNVKKSNQQINLQIICKKGENQLAIKSVEKIEENFFILTESQYGCPIIINSIFADLFNSFKFLIILIGLILGPLLLFYGSKMFGVALMIVIQQDQFFTYNNNKSIVCK